MKKAVIIIGGLTVIGVGAYLFFKPKKVLKDSVNQLDTDTTTPVPPKGTQLTTPEQVEEVALKIVEARELAKRICELKKQYNITNDNINDYMNFIGINLPFLGASTSLLPGSNLTMSRKSALETIKKNIQQLAKLGYRENNCKPIKLATELLPI